MDDGSPRGDVIQLREGFRGGNQHVGDFPSCQFAYLDTVCSMEAKPPECQSKPFSTHSNEAKNWARMGADLMPTYLVNRGT